MKILNAILYGFLDGYRGSAYHSRKERNIRTNLTEHQLDKMLMDSYPASDSPSTY